MNIRIGLFAALALVVPFSFVFAAAEAPDADSRPVVFYAVFKGIDPFLDFVETTVANDPKASAFLRVERQEWNAMLAADGPDLTRPIGLVVRLDGQTLVPTYFFPVKEKTNRLNNIVMLPQIYLPIKDEYGPTRRYQVRQDIQIQYGCAAFFWPLEPLLAEERDGWIWVTTYSGFESLPKEPRLLVPGFQWGANDYLRARFEVALVPKELRDGLLRLAAMALCETPGAPWRREKVGERGTRAVDAWRRYAVELCDGIQTVEWTVTGDKRRLDGRIECRVKPGTRSAELVARYRETPKDASLASIRFDRQERKLADGLAQLPPLFDITSFASFYNGETAARRIRDGIAFTPDTVRLSVSIAESFFPNLLGAYMKSAEPVAPKKVQRAKDEYDFEF